MRGASTTCSDDPSNRPILLFCSFYVEKPGIRGNPDLNEESFEDPYLLGSRPTSAGWGNQEEHHKGATLIVDKGFVTFAKLVGGKALSFEASRCLADVRWGDSTAGSHGEDVTPPPCYEPWVVLEKFVPLLGADDAALLAGIHRDVEGPSTLNSTIWHLEDSDA